MSSTVTEQVSAKNIESQSDIGYSNIWSSNNIGVPVICKGSPPSHLEGSPSSLSSNSSITSSTSANSLLQSQSTYPSVKYYDNHIDRGSTLLVGHNSIREEGVTIGFNSSVPMATSQMQTTIMAQAETNVPTSISDIHDLLTPTGNQQTALNRQLLFTPNSMNEDNNGTYINWLYDLYSPGAVGSSLIGNHGSVNKIEKVRNGSINVPMAASVVQQHQPLASSPELDGSGLLLKSDQNSPPPTHQDVKMDVDFPKEPMTLFRAQEKYLVVLGAPTSIAQRHGEDTLTYLNKGQFYNLFFRANPSLSLPDTVKSIIHLSFLDEPDRRVEYSHWQYWYDLQANPNQRSFDIDRKNCEGLTTRPIDFAYNAASFLWNPDKGAKIVLRINCLSTEFSSQKGVKGLPLHIVVDTYEDLETEKEPVHRVYCRVKIFRDKGAERKNKDETKTVERRLQKFIRSQQSVSLDVEIGPAAVFHPPCKETVLTPTSTFGQKPTLYNPTTTSGESKGIPIPVSSQKTQSQELSSSYSPCGTSRSPTGMSPSSSSLMSSKANFLASIREREMKRTFTKTLTQTKEDLLQLEVGPKYKSMKVPCTQVVTIYVRKEEEKVYNAIILDDPTIDGLKQQISKKYDIPEEMIRYVYKKTKKRLIVRVDDDMVTRFTDEDDFIIEIEFDNQKGHFDLYILY